MLKIDNSLLLEVGLGGLPDAEKNTFLKHIYETLEMRVGIRLADQMTNEQLDEFERYFEAKDDAGAFKWLETNFPNYKDIVQQEFDKLKAEVAQSAPQILAASQAQAAQPPASIGPLPAQPQPMADPGSPLTPPAPAGPPVPPAPAPQSPPLPSVPSAPPIPPSPQPAPEPPQAPAGPAAPPPGPAPFQSQPPLDPAPAAGPASPAAPPYPPQQPPAGPGALQ